jgi:hypothetical protein
MSNLEDRLRDAFRADAETVRAETIADLSARPMRRAPKRAGSRRLARAVAPLAAAAAVAAVAIGIWLVTPLLPEHGHPGPGASASSPPRLLLPTGTPVSRGVTGPVPSPVLGPAASRGVETSAPASGTPRFYVTVWIVSGGPTGGATSLIVRDTASGKVVGRLDPPRGEGFRSLAAPAGDSTFVTPVGSNSGCTSQLYQFTLNRQGQPGPLVPLHITVPGNYSEFGDLAVTPDGRTIAYATYLCGRGGGEVGVINLATRHVRVWSTSDPMQPAGLSLSADGSLLAYDTLPGARILNTSAPAGPLQERSRIVSRTAGWAALTADGASLYLCTTSTSSPAATRGTVTYGTYSIETGHQQVIASWPGLPYPQCWASLDPPSGRYLLVQYPVSVPNASSWVRPAILDLRSGQLTQIAAPAYYGPLDVAW